ncbi:hypothetical protein [Paenibacillus sp. LPE1-1-1.1]|uniref:hypothetical protein n=1 Tax=Paenibacillus sp. LPE1-1-1.1 TaxID=3135230 RepID=UPI0034267995
MKKTIAAITLMLLLTLTACSSNANKADNHNGESPVNTETPQNQNPETPKPSPTGQATDSNNNTDDDGPNEAATPDDAAANVMLALKESDMTTLKAYIHPDKGLLFSPYAHIDTASAKVFPAEGFPALTDTTVYHFGSYDGSGEPIDLTFQQYYDKFVYDKDFLEAETVGNDEIKGTGNMKVNIKEVFPDSYVMDYHFSGFDAQYEGMDWESLILVLEELDGAWYVSAIVHSQWTT